MQCVICGEYCTEGRMVCWSCERTMHEEEYDDKGEKLVKYTTELAKN